MIVLTRLNHASVIINADLIEHIDANPDTVICLTTGQKFPVLETTDEVIAKVVDFKRSFLDFRRVVNGNKVSENNNG